jgi:hypothetical protein
MGANINSKDVRIEQSFIRLSSAQLARLHGDNKMSKIDSHQYTAGWWNEKRLTSIMHVHLNNLTTGVYGAADRLKMVKEIFDRYNAKDFESAMSIHESSIAGWIRGAANGWAADETTDSQRVQIQEAAKSLRCYNRLEKLLPKSPEPESAPEPMDDEDATMDE